MTFKAPSPRSGGALKANATNDMRRRLQALVASVAVALFGCTKPIEARRLAREGNSAYRNGEFSRAVELYEQALHIDSLTPNTHLNLGYALYNLFDPTRPTPESVALAARAIDAFETHLSRHPDDDAARRFLDKAMIRAAPHDVTLRERAYRHFSEAMARAPDDPEARQYLVTLLIDCKWYDRALTHYEPYLRERPDDLDTMKLLAIIADRSGRTDDALEWYRRRAGAAPDNERKAALLYETGTWAWNILQYQPLRAIGPAGIMLADEGIEACREAMALKSGYAEAMTFANLLYLKRAALETDADSRQQDELVAYELRNAANEVIKSRPASAPPTTTGEAR